MLLGSVMYFAPKLKSERISKWALNIGLLMIFIAYIFVDSTINWPGWFTLLPVFGACLVLWSNFQSNKLLSNKVINLVGKYSYSIYLWHWPIVVAFSYFFIPREYMFFGILLSFILGGLSFTLVESRKKIELSNLRGLFTYSPLLAVIVLGLVGSTVYLYQGVPNRFEYFDFKNKLTMPARGNGYCFYSVDGGEGLPVSLARGISCDLGAKSVGKSRIVLFGDSYAGHLEPMLDETMKLLDLKFKSVTTNFCSPSLGDNWIASKNNNSYKQCKLNRKWLKDNIDQYDIFMLAATWRGDLHLSSVQTLTDYLISQGKKVIIYASPKSTHFNPLRYYYLNKYIGTDYNLGEMIRSVPDGEAEKLNEKLRDYASEYPEALFIERTALYDASGLFEYDGELIPYSFDGGHISILGGIASAKYFKKNKLTELSVFLKGVDR